MTCHVNRLSASRLVALLMYVCLVPSPQTVAELTAAVETNKETVERYLQARYSTLSPPSPLALYLLYKIEKGRVDGIPGFQNSSIFVRMWRRICLSPRLTGMEYREIDTAQNEPVCVLLYIDQNLG